MITAQEKEFIQFYRKADEDGKRFIIDLLCCFSCCGEEFVREIWEAHGQGKEAMLATVAKWKATIHAEVSV